MARRRKRRRINKGRVAALLIIILVIAAGIFFVTTRFGRTSYASVNKSMGAVSYTHLTLPTTERV